MTKGKMKTGQSANSSLAALNDLGQRTTVKQAETDFDPKFEALCASEGPQERPFLDDPTDDLARTDGPGRTAKVVLLRAPMRLWGPTSVSGL
jgi:hypothetical protein